MSPRARKLLPYIALAAAILSLGTSPFFIRWADAPGPITALYRTGLATIFLTPFFLHGQVQKPISLIPKILILPVAAGLFSACDLLFWTNALIYTRAANATLMGNLSPLWVALISWLFLRERLRQVFWIGLTLILVGGAVVMGGDLLLHPSMGFGDLLGVGSSLFYAGYFLFTQRGRKFFDTVRFLWIVNLASFLGILLYTQALGMPVFGYSLQTYLIFLGAALLSQTIGFFAVVYALGHLPASLVSPTLIGQPLLVAVLAIPLLGEYLLPSQWLGILAVVFGIYLIHRSRESSGEVLAAVPAEELLLD